MSVINNARLGLRKLNLEAGISKLAIGTAIELHRPLSGNGKRFLDLLVRALTLKKLPSKVTSGMALDFYTIPTDEPDRRKWPQTEIGKLVYDMKHVRGKPAESQAAMETLATRLAVLIGDNPVYRDAIVATIPGSRPSSWGERLAMAVASRTGQAIVSTRAEHVTRPQAKTGDPELDLTDELTLPDEAKGAGC